MYPFWVIYILNQGAGHVVVIPVQVGDFAPNPDRYAAFAAVGSAGPGRDRPFHIPGDVPLPEVIPSYPPPEYFSDKGEVITGADDEAP